MKTQFKIMQSLLSDIRSDLTRPHSFAHERVGFISAGISAMGEDLLILAREYRPVDDDDYLLDHSVGAMMGPKAINKALQWAIDKNGSALFHVHTHGGGKVPVYSGIDLQESAKFVPGFFKIAPQFTHGTILLSDNAIIGQVWLNQNESPKFIDEINEIGFPLRKWRTK